MSDSYQVAEALSKLATQKPKGVSGVAASIWDDLINLIKSAVQSIINGATSTISGVINTVKNAITDKIKGVTDFITTVGTNIHNWLFDEHNGLVSKLNAAVTNIVTQVKDTISNTLGSIGDAISGAIGKVVDAINSVVDAIKGIGQSIANAIAGVVERVGDWIKNALEDVLSGVGSIIADIVDTVSGWIKTVYQNIADFISNFATGLKNTIQAVKDWIDSNIKATKDFIEGIYNFVRKTVEDWFQAFLEWLAKTVVALVQWYNGIKERVNYWFEHIFLPHVAESAAALGKIKNGIAPIIDAINKGDYSGAINLLDKLFTDIGLGTPVHTLWGILSLYLYWQETIRLQFVPMEVAAQKRAVINLALEPMDTTIAHDAVDRGLMTEGEFIANARLAGISPDKAKIMNKALEPLTPVGVLRDIYLRGFISEANHDKVLADYGFTDTRIEQIKHSYPVIPSITDLVHFADRWAWDDRIAERFLYDTSFPDIVNSWANKIGLSADWFKRYWRSHWQLPGLEQVFEMFHRLRKGEVAKPFTLDDLNDYLKTTPLPPYFHDLLREITYLPLTRVDIRRMFKAGVINEKQVFNAYLDLGYDEVKAGWLRDFTIRYYTPEDTTQADEYTSLARSAYSQAYKHHIISEDEYKDFLKGLKISPEDIDLLVSLDNFSISQDNKIFDLTSQRQAMRKLALNAYNDGLIEAQEAVVILETLGYADNEANLELSVVDYNRALADRQLIVEAMHNQYVGYIIDEVELHNTMGMFNFSGLEIDKLIASWNIERSFRTKRPTLSDLKKFLNQGLITLDDFLNELRGDGMNEKYISLYEKSLTLAKG